MPAGHPEFDPDQLHDEIAALRGGLDRLGEVIGTTSAAPTQVQGVLVATDPVNGGPEAPHALPTLQNGWTDRGGEYAPSSYWLMITGEVALNLHLVAGTINSPTLLFTMPSAYIPAHSQIVPVAGDATTAMGPGSATLLIRGAAAVSPGQVQIFNIGGTATSRIHNAAARYHMTL